MTGPVEITQADRSAATDFLLGLCQSDYERGHTCEILLGNHDDNSAVQAFARHRIASKEAIVAMIEREFDAPHIVDAGRKITAAIRNLPATPAIAEDVQGGALYVRFSEILHGGSEAIRHWSRHPFEGAMRFDHRVGDA